MKLFGKMFPREEDEEFRDLTDKPEVEAALREAMKPAEEQELIMKIEGLDRRPTSRLPELKLADDKQPEPKPEDEKQPEPAGAEAPKEAAEGDALQQSLRDMISKKLDQENRSMPEEEEPVDEEPEDEVPVSTEMPALEIPEEEAAVLEEPLPEPAVLELSGSDTPEAEKTEPELPALEIAAEEVLSRSTMPKLRLDIPASASEPEKEKNEVQIVADLNAEDEDKTVAAVTYASMAEAMKQSTQSIPTSPTRKSRSAVDDDTLLAEIYALMGDTPPRSAAARQPDRPAKPAAQNTAAPEAPGNAPAQGQLRISGNMTQNRQSQVRPEAIEANEPEPETEAGDDEIPVRVEEQGAPGWLKGVFLLLISAVLSGMTLYAVAADVLGKFY